MLIVTIGGNEDRFDHYGRAWRKMRDGKGVVVVMGVDSDDRRHTDDNEGKDLTSRDFHS